MNIRLATFDDPIEEFARIGIKDHERSAYAKFPYCIGSVMKMLIKMIEDELLLVAEEDGVIAGGIGARLSRLDFNNKIVSGAMRFWWVDEPFQKTRLATRLLTEIEAQVRRKGCEVWMLCSVDSGREMPLTRMFERFGYKLSERMYIKVLS